MHIHRWLIAISVLLAGTLGAVTLGDLSPTALPSKTLELSFEGGDAAPPPSGSWTASFGKSPAKDVTITGFPGKPGSYKTTWTYAGAPFPDSHGYDLAASPVFGGKPASITLWISESGIRFYLTIDGASSYGGVVFKSIQQPEIGVQASGRNLADQKSVVSFAKVVVGKSGAAKKFTIKNTGKAALTSLALKKSGPHAADFRIGALSRKTIPAGGTATFTVKFQPKAKGARKAAIAIRSNDADENPFDVKLTGQGTAK